MVAHAYNSSTQETTGKRIMSSKPAWIMSRDPSQEKKKKTKLKNDKWKERTQKHFTEVNIKFNTFHVMSS
jgi:hypothetical protein